MRQSRLPAGFLKFAFLIAASLGNHALAVTITYSSDSDFLGNAEFTKQFGYNVKNGNAASNGDWEYAIVNSSDVPQSGSEQLAWDTDTQRDHDFLFSYDGSGGAQLDLTDITGGLADRTNSGNVSGLIGSEANAIVIRASNKNGGVNAQVDLSGLMISFVEGGSDILLGSLLGDSDAQYIMVVDSRVAGGFSITGHADYNIGNYALSGSGSSRMYQAKIGVSAYDVSAVPLPPALLLFGSGLLGLAAMARRRLR